MTPSRIVIKLGGASLQDEAVLSVFAGASGNTDASVLR
jgi:hypothetical protein